MPVIIHIETSTTVCSVAVSHGGELIVECVECEGLSHAVKLPQFIEASFQAVKENQVTVNALSVSVSPG